MSESSVSPAESNQLQPRVKHRPVWIIVIALGCVICIGMGYWQLTRFNSASGNAQNLGYTFMWPFMALFMVYAYSRYVRLEASEAAELAAEKAELEVHPDGSREVRRAPARAERAVTSIPEDFLPAPRSSTVDNEPVDPTLRAYNEYLAALDRDGTTTPGETRR